MGPPLGQQPLSKPWRRTRFACDQSRSTASPSPATTLLPEKSAPVEHLGSSAHFGLTAKAIREGKHLDALVAEISGSRVRVMSEDPASFVRTTLICRRREAGFGVPRHRRARADRLHALRHIPYEARARKRSSDRSGATSATRSAKRLRSYWLRSRPAAKSLAQPPEPGSRSERSLALELQVLVGSGVGVVGDQGQASFRHAGSLPI